MEVIIESMTKPENPKKGIKYNDKWHTVMGRAANYVDTLNMGDVCEIKEGEGGAVVFIQKKVGIEETRPQEVKPDRFSPIGDLYAMCEEKLNATVQQNSMNNALLIKICEKLQIDINEIKSQA